MLNRIILLREIPEELGSSSCNHILESMRNKAQYFAFFYLKCKTFIINN